MKDNHFNLNAEEFKNIKIGYRMLDVFGKYLGDYGLTSDKIEYSKDYFPFLIKRFFSLSHDALFLCENGKNISASIILRSVIFLIVNFMFVFKESEKESIGEKIRLIELFEEQKDNEVFVAFFSELPNINEEEKKLLKEAIEVKEKNNEYCKNNGIDFRNLMISKLVKDIEKHEPTFKTFGIYLKELDRVVHNHKIETLSAENGVFDVFPKYQLNNQDGTISKMCFLVIGYFINVCTEFLNIDNRDSLLLEIKAIAKTN